VIAAALELLGESGLDGLSMRNLAARLDVSTPTVYWWVGNKEQLLAYMADHVMGEIELPVLNTGCWRDQLRQLAERAYRVFHRNRALLPVFSWGVPVGPNTLRVMEQWMTILTAAGFDPERAVAAQHAISAVILHCIPRTADDDLSWTEGHSLEILPEDRFPALHRTGRALQGVSMEQRFRFGLEIAMRGVDSVLADPPRAG
jgi:AcrR family transcriptional regulator